MTTFTQNDSWLIKRLKQMWPIFLAIFMGLAWVVSQYYDFGTRVGASEEDIREIKQSQIEEIAAREELLTEIQAVKQELPAIKESIGGLKKQNEDNRALLLQILQFLRN